MSPLLDPLLKEKSQVSHDQILNDAEKHKNSAFLDYGAQKSSDDEAQAAGDARVQTKQSFGRSLKQHSWILLEPDWRLVSHISQALGLDEITSRILVNRGITSLEEAREFLDPKLKSLLPDPFTLLDMDKAVQRTIEAIKKGEKITIFADYDVDGATSSALIYKFLEKIGVTSHIYVADRLNEGYGPSKIAMQKLHDNGTQLIITVDCGISAYEPLHFAKQLGLDVIVVDHHLSPQAKLPEAVAVVNPNRFDESFPDKSMAAVGVSFLFITALRKKMREYGWFRSVEKEELNLDFKNLAAPVTKENSSAVVGNAEDNFAPPAKLYAEPNLFEFLDLVALGTICDVVPLTLLNRTMVQHGLRYLGRNSNLGLSILMEQTRIESKLSAYHLGYVLGPRINAGGRIDESSLGTQLLTTHDLLHAREIAKRLEQLNNERKSIEQQAVEQAIEQVERQQLDESSPVLIVYSEGWHVGVLGILASRLKEKYRKPCIVIAIKDGVGKGSGRSIMGFNIGQALARAKESGLLIDGGGHAMAGGFSIEPGQIEPFIGYMKQAFESNKTAEAILDKARQLEIDVVVRASGINVQLLDFLEQLGPFGQGNPQPRFVIKRVRLVKIIVTHKNHLIILAEDAEKMHIKRLNSEQNQDNIGISPNKTVKCILFRGSESEIGEFVINNSHKIFHIAGLIQPSNIEFGKVDFIVDDIAVEE